MIDIEEVIFKNINLTDDVIDMFREGYGEDIAELFLIQRSLVQEVMQLRGELRLTKEWADNVREFFGDEAMVELYDIYGGEEE